MFVRIPLQRISPVHAGAPDSNLVRPEYQNARHFLSSATKVNVSIHHLEECESAGTRASSPGFTTDHAVYGQAQIIASDLFLVRRVPRNNSFKRRPRQCQNLDVRAIGPRSVVLTQKIVVEQQLVHAPDCPPCVHTCSLPDGAPVEYIKIPWLRKVFVGFEHGRGSLGGDGRNTVHPNEAEEPHLTNPGLARRPLHISFQYW
mmetsp:Transcript_34033/g.88891  ORF Transcript_34033/g.88891 Transcript_34033/m.88891 type:complete len:202 (+) Transcript_34033:324-929(+)